MATVQLVRRLKKTRAGCALRTAFTLREVDILPVADRLSCICPGGWRQHTALEIVDAYAHATEAEILHRFGKVVLVFVGIDPEFVPVVWCIPGRFQAHESYVDDKRHVPVNVLRELAQPGDRELVQDHAQLHRHMPAGKMVESRDRLVKGAVCLDDVIVKGGSVTIERNP